MYEHTISDYIASAMEAKPIGASYNREQMRLLSNDGILPVTRKNTLNSGTLQYGFPYDHLATSTGAVLGYYTGVGITKTRHWCMDKLIQCYRPVKAQCANWLSYLGWKLVDKSKDLKDE
jgi:hypothetical protein